MFQADNTEAGGVVPDRLLTRSHEMPEHRLLLSRIMVIIEIKIKIIIKKR
jgi:hypothetical protein